ncbi:MAG: ribonuclease P protein component [Candidatus Colwellbacteria bacterium]|nr:ribonuclease P protein component [Candidatus Colwellbacteria bacterium]
MLAKQYRLPVDNFSSKARVLLRGKVVVAKATVSTAGFLRVGVLTSRKNIKSAAVRNAVKRLILDSFAPFTTGPKNNLSTDLLIIVAAPIIKLDSQITSRLSADLEMIRTLLPRTRTSK